MIGMGFGSFLTLLILGLIGAAVLHYAFRYRMLSGLDGFLAKWVVGWIAAWLGSPVLGHWAFQIAGVYIIPAIIGAFAGAFLAVATLKAIAMATAPAARSVPLETRKAAD
jgi:uncharacterized membrane protein YeaQ/YmgE (transglycosylase-associated protein family)